MAGHPAGPKHCRLIRARGARLSPRQTSYATGTSVPTMRFTYLVVVVLLTSIRLLGMADRGQRNSMARVGLL